MNEDHSYALLQAIFRIADDAIITVDDKQNILMFNLGAERIFGYCSEEIVGSPLDLLLPERFRKNHQSYVSEFAESGVDARHMNGRPDIYGRRKDGSEFPAEASISTVVVAKKRFFTAVVRDVSERREQEELRNASLREKEILLQEVHHRVKNNLQTICSLLSLQADAVDHPAVSDAFNEAQNRVRSIALIHERLYRAGDFGKIDFASYADELSKSLLISFQAGQRVQFEIAAGELTLPMDKSIPCGLILNELLTNSLKHAFPNNRAGSINVTLSTHGDNLYVLEYADDGVGLPEDFDMLRCSTLGMQLVVNLTGQLLGNVDLNTSSPGFSVRIEFPHSQQVEISK